MNLSKMYVERSKKNIRDSDGTIAFRIRSSPGTDKSIGFCLTGKWKKVEFKNLQSTFKPLLVIEDLSIENENLNVKRMVNFIITNDIKVLNICGHREDDKYNFSFTDSVKKILLKVFKLCKNKTIEEVEKFIEK